MWDDDNLLTINWEQYNRQGLNRPDLLKLIRELASQDWLVRQNANSELEKQLEWAYERVHNELPFEIAPILIRLLQVDDLPEKGIVTNLLILLISYSEIETLQEPHRTEAFRLKSKVCEGVEIYRSLLADADLKEDISFLLESCAS